MFTDAHMVPHFRKLYPERAFLSCWSMENILYRQKNKKIQGIKSVWQKYPLIKKRKFIFVPCWESPYLSSSFILSVYIFKKWGKAPLVGQAGFILTI